MFLAALVLAVLMFRTELDLAVLISLTALVLSVLMFLTALVLAVQNFSLTVITLIAGVIYNFIFEYKNQVMFNMTVFFDGGPHCQIDPCF